jgi:protein SCO1/2
MAERKLNPAHWMLFQGSEHSVRDLAAALGIGYRKDENGDFDHAYSITLLDADGVVAYQQTGVQPDTDEFLSKLKALRVPQAQQ